MRGRLQGVETGQRSVAGVGLSAVEGDVEQGSLQEGGQEVPSHHNSHNQISTQTKTNKTNRNLKRTGKLIIKQQNITRELLMCRLRSKRRVGGTTLKDVD